MRLSARHSPSDRSGSPVTGLWSFFSASRRSSVSGWLSRMVKVPFACAPGEPEQQFAQRRRGTAELAHGLRGERIRVALGIARIGGVQQGSAREEHSAARRSRRRTEARSGMTCRRLDDLSHAVAVFHMAQFVREDAGEFVRALRLFQKTVQHIDLSAWQRERICDFRRQHQRLESVVDTAGALELADQRGKGRLPVRGAARIAA